MDTGRRCALQAPRLHRTSLDAYPRGSRVQTGFVDKILPRYIPIGIHINHMDMTKFTSKHDPGFVAVSGEFRRWIKDIDAAESHRENPPYSNNQDCGRAARHCRSARRWKSAIQQCRHGHAEEC
ncbi:hypothetical protein N658DRAFT_502112 [Parathielavia hyrcaniae]|uniref:Uncharacterized protein n=1 Tax=Parathielavia hyrcaniae TaxID=113614 RepID=A0AAN6PQM2_9PEZI|nr:hypothetical protein N658DRAFT_502112 [Parathielavia hyrcaniae]